MNARWLPVAVLAALIAGCATYTPKARVGQSADELIRDYGAPTGRYPLPNGTRLEYARGPYGHHTFMIDVDAAGRVTGIEQVLTENHFFRVKPGMKRDELLLMLGRPSERRGAWMQRDLWFYRYQAPFCRWFVVTLERDGTVRDSGFTPDPMCDDQDRDMMKPGK